MRLTRYFRRGITLVELLVVMSIMAVLAGVVAIFAPRMMDHARVPDGAQQLQSWMQVARQRAIRDQAPRGIRLLSGPAATLPVHPATGGPTQAFYNKFVYVEQPEDITGTPTEFPLPGGAGPNPRAILQSYFFSQTSLPLAYRQAYLAPTIPGPGPPQPNTNGYKCFLWLQGRNLGPPAPGEPAVLKAGDVVEFGSSRYALLLDAIADSTIPSFPSSNGCILVLHRPRDESRTPASALPSYRITRSPQPIAGEPELELQRDVAIDVLIVNRAPPQPAPAQLETRSLPAPEAGGPPGKFDIMFNQTGEVTGSLATYGKIILWVRDINLGEPATGNRGDLPPGDNRLIVIHSRTGMVTAHPVHQELDASGKLVDPYKYVRDGKSSAME